MGQNEEGEVFFRSGDVVGENTARAYKATLDWHDAPADAASNSVGVILGWKSRSNTYYQIQGSQDLSSNDWVNVGLGFHGDGLTNWLYYPADNRTTRFFKLVQ